MMKKGTGKNFFKKSFGVFAGFAGVIEKFFGVLAEIFGVIEKRFV